MRVTAGLLLFFNPLQEDTPPALGRPPIANYLPSLSGLLKDFILHLLKDVVNVMEVRHRNLLNWTCTSGKQTLIEIGIGADGPLG